MSTSLEEMNLLAEKIARLRNDEAEASRIKRGITSELELAENTMIEFLQKNDLKNYRAPAGLCTVTFLNSVKTPKTPEAKQAFYAFLKEKGHYDELVSVNSQKLNSFYKEQFELARERGDTDFEIPGLTEVTTITNLSFKRG
jgi:hypothetical protein